MEIVVDNKVIGRRKVDEIVGHEALLRASLKRTYTVRSRPGTRALLLKIERDPAKDKQVAFYDSSRVSGRLQKAQEGRNKVRHELKQAMKEGE